MLLCQTPTIFSSELFSSELFGLITKAVLWGMAAASIATHALCMVSWLQVTLLQPLPAGVFLDPYELHTVLGPAGEKQHSAYHAHVIPACSARVCNLFR